MTEMKKILITGATGATGKVAIKKLLELQIPVRAMVHRIDARSEELSALRVEVVEGDLSDFDSVSAALEGITGAYFVYPIQVPGILEATTFFTQAAIEEGVGFIVNMSQISARRIAKSHAAVAHWLSERLFDRSGIPVAHIRPTFFAEWIMYVVKTIREQSLLVLPFGETPYAPIAAEDIGRVVAHLLADPSDHAGQTYSLFGPREVTQSEVAQDLSDVLGRKITYYPMEIAPFQDVLKGMGFNAHFIQHISAVAQDCRDGFFSGTNDNVEKITGQKPLPMKDYIVKHRELFSSITT
jgi:NAD(P)H dehydrogenase (quinone)